MLFLALTRYRFGIEMDVNSVGKLMVFCVKTLPRMCVVMMFLLGWSVSFASNVSEALLIGN
jgi:hypothetical protein